MSLVTNADLIAEARALTSWYVAGSDWVVQATELMPQLADALEAAEAQVARLVAALALHGHLTAREGTHLHPWPADLLAAVQTVDEIGGRGWDTLTGMEYDKQTAEWDAARAILRRYCLLPAAPEGSRP